jgi:hypothetical protein
MYSTINLSSAQARGVIKNGIFKNLSSQALIDSSGLDTLPVTPQITNNFRREPDLADEVLQLGSADDFPWSGGFGGPVVVSRKSLLGTARVVMLAKARKRAAGQFRRSWRCGGAGRMVTGLGVRGPSSR